MPNSETDQSTEAQDQGVETVSEVQVSTPQGQTLEAEESQLPGENATGENADQPDPEQAKLDKKESIEKRIASAAGKLSLMLSNKSLDQIVSSDAGEGEKSSALLIIVSKRLFAAFTILIIIGFVLILGLNYFGKGDNITLPMVMFCGVLGGFVGIQRRLKDLTIRDLEILAISKVYLCLSPLVGGVLAVVLYILFVSNLLAGELFPTFEAGTDANTKANIEKLGFNSILHQFATAGHSGYAKLMFWCFLAGFSERFVTDVIGKFEGKAVKAVDS